MAVKRTVLAKTNEAKNFDDTLKIQEACESKITMGSLVKKTPNAALVKACEQDLDTVRMINSTLKSGTHTGFLNESDMLDVFKHGAVFLVKIDMKTVGTISFRPYKEDGNTALFRNLEILQEHQGEGIGTMAMGLLLGKVKELGFKKARLRVRPDKDKAQHIYEKLGFVKVCDDNSFGDGVLRLAMETEL